MLNLGTDNGDVVVEKKTIVRIFLGNNNLFTMFNVIIFLLVLL